MDFHVSATSGTHWTIREEIVEVGRRRKQYPFVFLGLQGLLGRDAFRVFSWLLFVQ